VENNKFAEAVEVRKQARIRNEAKYRENSKRRLVALIEKKMKTTMIGALSSFEESFGYLWGINKHHSSLSEEELILRELWENTRTEILNKGNNQIRATKEELGQHNVVWQPYKMDFIVQPTTEEKR